MEKNHESIKTINYQLKTQLAQIELFIEGTFNQYKSKNLSKRQLFQ